MTATENLSTFLSICRKKIVGISIIYSVFEVVSGIHTELLAESDEPSGISR
jgi:hypothetical protein